jgi:co-chaperonin GroES (HSP10)
MIRPVRDVLLIEVMKEDSPMRAGIILPRADMTNFDIAKVIEVGNTVKDFKKGDLIYVHHGIWEPMEIGTQKGFIKEERCFAIIEGSNSET